MKICPETGSPVLYLDCLECETKTCRKSRNGQREDADRESTGKDTDDGKHA